MDTLVCTKCKQLLPTTAFVRRPAVPRGYQSICKACTRQRNQRIKAMPLADRVIPKAKRCTTCGELKKITAFPLLRRNPDGHRPQCQPCYSASRGESLAPPPLYWLAGPEGIEPGAFCTACQRVVPMAECRTDTRGYRRRTLPCLACRTQKRTAWRAEHREQDQATVLRSWHRNYDRWSSEQPDWLLSKNAKRRALLLGATSAPFTGKDWEQIKHAYNYCCAYCGEKPDTLTMDHVIPLSKGGTHSKDNIVPACLPCNLMKHTKLMTPNPPPSAA